MFLFFFGCREKKVTPSLFLKGGNFLLEKTSILFRIIPISQNKSVAFLTELIDGTPLSPYNASLPLLFFSPRGNRVIFFFPLWLQAIEDTSPFLSAAAFWRMRTVFLLFLLRLTPFSGTPKVMINSSAHLFSLDPSSLMF